MSVGHESTRFRGVALLIVLATLILTVSASATLAQLAATIKLQRQFDERTTVANDLLISAEAPILHWLKSKSASVVLPPDAQLPGPEILHDQFGRGQETIVLRIQAFDQCGMAPISIARSGSPIRLALPQSVLSALDKMTLEPNQTPGLDLFLVAISATPDELPVFPSIAPNEPAWYGADPLQTREMSARSIRAPQSGPPFIGSSIATHNPGLINVNTAPINLVEAAMRSSGMGGIEQVIQARSQGKLAGVPSTRSQIANDEKLKLQLASSSSAWSFRIDIEIGLLHRSWWAVYIRNSSQWECVQRLAVPE